MEKAVIFDIQRFSVHDGYGIRTTVFFKGCTLNCVWCQNPESISAKKQLLFHSELCITCGACAIICGNGHKILHNKHVFNRRPCISCGKCTSACLTKALVVSGKEVTVNDICDEVVKDKKFYSSSGGGVTFSGGEPLVYSLFIRRVMDKLKKVKVGVAIQTAGNVKWENIERVIDADIFMYDLKLMDPGLHKKYTGYSNDLILQNLRKLSALRKVVVRTPLIPGITDTKKNVAAIKRFVSALPNVIELKFLPYNEFTPAKYNALGLKYKLRSI
ncbi:MAG: glycyl-radical enzyme activating protein [Elusimicrobiota bacterium]